MCEPSPSAIVATPGSDAGGGGGAVAAEQKPSAAAAPAGEKPGKAIRGSWAREAGGAVEVSRTAKEERRRCACVCARKRCDRPAGEVGFQR